MEDHRIDYRWGIPALDSGFTTIPNFIIRHYAELGVTRSEFTFIVHLASYKFDSPKGQASPALQTIASQMGLKLRQARYIRASLEKKGFLKVTERSGRTSVYDFQGLALACLELENAGGDDAPRQKNASPPRQKNASPPRQSTAYEEQEQQEQEKQQQPVVVVSSTNCSDPEGRLRELGVGDGMAARLVREHGEERVSDVLAHLKRSAGPIKNPSGWVISALKTGYALSEPIAASAASDLLVGQRARCAFLRNPGLGECPTEEAGVCVFPWCKGCERAVLVAP